MITETVAFISLGALVVILSFLLITRGFRERREMAAIRRMNLAEFSAFLRVNSLDGSIHAVAGKVSDLLKGALGCELIIFLRKKRGYLELNYSHGLRNVDRRDFHLPYGKSLSETLRKDFLPQPISALKPVLPTDFFQLLGRLEVDLFLPILWRENLYGLYFVRAPRQPLSPQFGVLVAALAQSLSAAYHIKWHETRHEVLQRQLDAIRAEVQNAVTDDRLKRNNILRLVRHRNSETIAPKIIEAIKVDLEIDRIAYVYESGGESTAPLVFRQGLTGEVVQPERRTFEEVLKVLRDREPVELDELGGHSQPVADWARSLKAGGLKYIASFPLSSQRAGLIAWGSNAPAKSTFRQLDILKAHTMEVVDNAESYRRIEELSFTDNLTGLANQRYFFKRLDEEVSRAKRYGRDLALILFDLDQLKNINDSHGHLAGDAVLKQLGDILRNSIRSIDIVARYGGDEFCVIMPEADGVTCARFMERLKSEVEGSEFRIEGIEGNIRCTASLGGAIFPEHADSPKTLVFNADMALLKAKEAGKNRCLLYS
jgi:diguanylate cyclase (GGDEF)-like protein